MALAAGTRLGTYEIVSCIGAGGMGEVYKARDTKLNREVALKILPDAFALDSDRLARFKREAQMLASLNHPNIAAIYGFEDTTGVQALVLELVEGPTLADRLGNGPMALDDALPIARQIVDALEAAHEQGVVHRDLKPANIKVRGDGTVKVLDFGLAKLADPVAAGPATTQFAVADSPTARSPGMTGAGVVLGTAAYMSPEQARGQAVDRRSDIWAFGCVLYEMLTGRPLFDGETITDVIARIVTSEPDWTRLPRDTSPSIRALLAAALNKERRQRLQHIGDARLFMAPVSHPDPTVLKVPTHPRGRFGWPVVVSLAAALGAALVPAGLYFRQASPREVPAGEVVRFAINPPENTAFRGSVNNSIGTPQFAMAPDGRTMVFAAASNGARSSLWLRTMEDVTARVLQGTENAEKPFWSADGRWIGFFADGKVKKIPAAGGPVQTIADAIDPRGGTWGANGTILFGTGGEVIYQVSSAGGPVTAATTKDTVETESHRYPQFFPDGRHFLFTVRTQRPERRGVWVASLDGPSHRVLDTYSSSVVYVAPGYLLYLDNDILLAQPFDIERFQLTGQAATVAEGVGRAGDSSGAFAASTTALAYSGILGRPGRLTWLDRQGNALGSIGPDGEHVDFRLSADETRLVHALVDNKVSAANLWLTDVVGGRSSPLIQGSINSGAIWSRDGGRIFFRSNRRGGLPEIYEISAAGGGNPRLVLAYEALQVAGFASAAFYLSDASPDGRHVAASSIDTSGFRHIWFIPLESESKPFLFHESSFDQGQANFSPDGHLVAYSSNESGRFEISVQTFPRSDKKWPVSTDGGYEPRWRADGREIYYLSADGQLMAAPVGVGPSFGVPKPLFKARTPFDMEFLRTSYVPSRDGQRFLVNTASREPSPTPITVVWNWTRGLGTK